MNSPTKTLPLYFVTAVFAAVAYLLLSTLCKCLRGFLHRQLHDGSSLQIHGYHVPAVNVTLHPVTASQLEEHPIITFVGQNPPETESCSVCLGDYSAGDELRELSNCKHRFHKECVDRWLVTRSSFCPICRGQAIVRRGDHC